MWNNRRQIIIVLFYFFYAHAYKFYIIYIFCLLSTIVREMVI